MTDLNHVENMRVSQAKAHLGDVRFYVVTANGGIVRRPCDFGDGTGTRAQAQLALDEIREGAYEEAAAEGDPED